MNCTKNISVANFRGQNMQKKETKKVLKIYNNMSLLSVVNARSFEY